MWRAHVGRGILPAQTLEMPIMNDQSSSPTPRRVLKPRRLALLASVAALTVAVLAAGPARHLPFDLPALATSAHAAETAQNTAGFADLVAKVKPAVISVRVKIDDEADAAAVTQRDGGMDSDQSNPFDQFSRQF